MAQDQSTTMNRTRPGMPGFGLIPALAVFVTIATMVALATAAAAQQISLERMMPGERLERPVHLAAIPDGSRRLAVVEQQGRVVWFRPGAKRAGGVLIDIRPRVNSAGWEEGLLSIAFDPKFLENRFAYLYYSASSPRRSVVARIVVPEGERPADPATMEVVIEISQPYPNHNGGQLAFGPDGMLYIGLGDGGAGGDPLGNGQGRRTLLGSILRIDVARREGGRGYAIPADNPFTGGPEGARPEIWAYGLRNPWRFSFDRETGRLFAGDVGQNTEEEVDIIVRGGNYGWNRMEGARCYGKENCDRSGLIAPIAVYGRERGVSITGGFVYRGREIPALIGQYLFADYGSGTIFAVLPTAEGKIAAPRDLERTKLRISSFGEDSEGELYVIDHRGAVYRIVPRN